MKLAGLTRAILLIVLIHLGQEVAGLPNTCENCGLSNITGVSIDATRQKLTKFLDCVKEDKVDINGLCFVLDKKIFNWGDNNATGLAYASLLGLRNFTSRFLSLGALPNITGPDGYTALMYATGNGSQGIVADLLKNGADVNAQDKEGLTPLMHAAQENSTAVVNILLKNGADVSALSNGGLH